MNIWVDAQISPAIATWICRSYPQLEALAVRDIGLRDAEDIDIFKAAHLANAIVMTKDRDFVELLDRYGAPPKIIWITCGNTSNANLRTILSHELLRAISILQNSETLVEIASL